MSRCIVLAQDAFTLQRQAYFEYLGFEVHIVPGLLISQPHCRELPRAYGKRCAEYTHEYLLGYKEQSSDIVVSMHTIVLCGRRVIPTPQSHEQAQSILKLLSGRRHRVLTTLIIGSTDKKHTRQVETMVQWKHLSPQEHHNYIAGQHYANLTGGYLPLAFPQYTFIKSINGCPSNLKGIPYNIINNIINSL